MTAPASITIDMEQLTISAAVAIAEAPFVELENQSRDLATMAACGFLSKQDAVDVAYTASLAAIGGGTWYRHDPDAIQEIIASGFEMAQLDMQRSKKRDYWLVSEDGVASAGELQRMQDGWARQRDSAHRTTRPTINAFWYVVGLGDEAYLTRWLADHPDDAPYLRKLLEDRCTKSS